MTDIHIRVIPREKISRLARYELTDTDVSIGFYENDPWLTTRLASMHQDPQRFLSLADKTFVFLSLFSFLDFAILDDVRSESQSISRYKIRRIFDICKQFFFF